MSSATLTSLAMLKVNVDHGRDYLDYLSPFILQVIVDQRPDPITDAIVRDHIRVQFGLEIPERTIQIVLKRIARSYPLKKEKGVYRVVGTLPDPGIAQRKAEADRHLQAVVAGLKDFSKDTARPFTSDDEAITAICTFLTEFDIPCLRAYLRGTTIPDLAGKHSADIILVSQYVLRLQRLEPERFDSFLVILQGHMLANALLCPDLQNMRATYQRVTFFLDTPLLVRRLGLEGEPRRTAIESLIELLRNLGADVAAFSHSRDELERVVRGAADHIDDQDGRGDIVFEARRRGTSRSDLLLLAGKIDEELENAGIDVKETPIYKKDFQIDEAEFEKALDDEVSYYNPRAREYDVNSVRSIYVLRAGTVPGCLEKARAVLVTNNVGFAKAAYSFGQGHEDSREVSSVITDFSLANMAWLKAPVGAPSLPMAEVLSFSYAALQPSKELLSRYFGEIEKLEKRGKISARDHQLLRSSIQAQEDLLHLTLGDEKALTQETIIETLSRLEGEIRREESERLSQEKIAHRKTQSELASQRSVLEEVKARIYWRSRKRAKICAWFFSVFIGVLLVTGFATGFGLRAENRILGWVLIVTSGLVLLMSLANLVLGTTVKSLHGWVQAQCLDLFIKRNTESTGLSQGIVE